MAYPFYYSELMHDLFKQFLYSSPKAFQKGQPLSQKREKERKILVRFHYHHRAIDQEPGT